MKRKAAWFGYCIHINTVQVHNILSNSETIIECEQERGYFTVGSKTEHIRSSCVTVTV